ncbi:NADH-quinone oxidoreductase subunit K [Hoyosella rhizosphaerae]|uniref:Uncharacterized protein n=1 Tax=Hoyosella rhizosphaerae TaxID=1755582 RepID=A0A916U646_9ACTN|nr:NADH-quinone oxidoreductase subunit K [Hoyosella rhizosphaerae]MBN4926204.1 NADH-quinone oxidoreductase subunit K [Hoyosella rhizosphaerae]GGC61274.1 hypothetical protein GCM10011410_12170 [Hoyosella rhizosphaerae]
MTQAEWFLFVGVGLFVLGTVRMLLTVDDVRRIVALNIASAGVLVVLIALATVLNPEEPDAVLHALVLTGIVITVSITGLALVLVRRIERAEKHASNSGGAEDA